MFLSVCLSVYLSVCLSVSALQDYDAALQLRPEDQALQKDRQDIQRLITQAQTQNS